MENILLAVVTENREYARALSLAMLNVCRDFIVKILSREEFMSMRRNFYDNSSTGTFCGQFDLILWDGEEVREVYGDSIIFMTEKPSLAVKDFANKRFGIYKYSTAKALVADIFEIYSILTGRRAVNLRRHDVRIFAFASWAGGTGCTTLALSFAQELCRFRGKRVMYLSFEAVESTGQFVECPQGLKGSGVYLYQLFKNGVSIKGRETISEGSAVSKSPFLEEYTVKDAFGVEAFAPTKGKNPLNCMSVDELQVFMASLIDCGRYDVITIDLGSCLSEVGVGCLELAERICMVSKMTPGGNLQVDLPISSPREEQYLRQVTCDCGHEMMDKIIKAVNMFSGEETIPATEDMSDEKILYIGKNSNLLPGAAATAIELDGKYGRDINALAEKMMEQEFTKS